MRSILVHIHDDRCLEARLQVALDLVRGFDGHMTCLQSMPFDLAITGDLYGDMAAGVLPEMRKLSEELRARLEGRLSKEDVNWDWNLQDDTMRYALQDQAILSDLIVMGACDGEGGNRAYSALAAEVVVHVECPVLVVPEKAEGLDLGGPVAVAWNGSVESCRALQAAMPILLKASEVHLLTVVEENQKGPMQLPPTSGAIYLARHGVESEITELPCQKGDVAQTIVQAAVARDATCIVMGAYGHTRLRETLLGGVSRSMMTNPPLPLLLAH